MTPSRKKSTLESGFGDELATESSITPWASPSPVDAFTSQWYVTGMQNIYTEDVQAI